MKNTFKQKFAFLLALTMLLSTLPTTALALEDTPAVQTGEAMDAVKGTTQEDSKTSDPADDKEDQAQKGQTGDEQEATIEPVNEVVENGVQLLNGSDSEIIVKPGNSAEENGQALVEAVEEAASGATIIVPEGEYKLSSNTYISPVNGNLYYGLKIDKDITLKGAGAGKTTITSDVGGYNSGMVLFTEYDVDATIDGFTFEGGSWDIIGCDDPGVKNVTITNCEFDSTGTNSTPIKLKLLSGEISNNTFTGDACGYGVRIIGLDKRESSWDNDVPTNLKVDIDITNNDFSGLTINSAHTDRGVIQVATGDPGTVTISENNLDIKNGFAVKADNSTAVVEAPGNYWGKDASLETVAGMISGSVSMDNYYTDSEMKDEVEVGGIPVATEEQLRGAVAAANDGDTVVVAAGAYDISEPIVIEKSITIQGANAGVDARPEKSTRTTETVMDGNAITQGWDSGCIFVISADDVTIDGFTFDDANYAAVAIGSADNTKDVEIKNAVIQNNIFKSTNRNCDQAITGEEQKYPCTVQNNYFENVKANVKVLSAHGIITDNQFDDCSSSGSLMLFYDDNYDYSKDLTFSGNVVNGYTGGSAVVSAQWLYNIVANDNVISDTSVPFIDATVSIGLEAKGNSFSDVALGDKNLIDINWFDDGNFRGYSIQENDFSTGITTTGKIIDVQQHTGSVPNNENDFDNITVDASKNYWGENASLETIAGMISGNVGMDSYYTTINDAGEMSGEVEVGGIPVTPKKSLQDVINAAEDGATIVLAPGTYDGNITFSGKSITIKAQYPAYKGGKLEEDSKLTKFTGTFNTYGGTNIDSFKEEQSVIIEGIAFSGDGLKVGNNNYNSVGNLEVRNCTMEFGKSLGMNANNYAQYNYFVKTSGGNELGTNSFASIVIEDNYISGEPKKGQTNGGEIQIYPIQVWRVKNVTIQNNIIDLEGDMSETAAIAISKLSENADIMVANNKITNANTGVSITTWLSGSGSDAFNGNVTITGNAMSNITGEKVIAVGYDDAGDYSQYGGALTVEKNTNNGDPVGAVVTWDPEETRTNFVATIKNGDDVLAQYMNANNKIDLPSAPDKDGYEFDGWYSAELNYTYNAGDEVTIDKDTTFTAVWDRISSGGAYHPEAGDSTSSDRDDDDTEEIEEDDVPLTEDKVADFADVASDAWYADAVQYVYENGMMSGTSETTFSPDLTTTRGMIVTILYRLENEPAVTGTTAFTDVAADQYYANAVAWAAQNGIVSGTGATTFAPNAAITREQMAAILYRYAQFKGYDVSAKADLSVYTDAANVGAYAADAMAWANGAQLITGTSEATLTPAGQATRAQVATILMRFCENIAK